MVDPLDLLAAEPGLPRRNGSTICLQANCDADSLCSLGRTASRSAGSSSFDHGSSRPFVIVRTTHYLALARATPSILREIDPKSRTNDDRTGWRYEGFFFEAQDEHSIPFLGAFNFWRGRDGGGGQFARSDPLFPFAHG
jgi:hypothetical protein